jgi:hypothetical protein
LFDILTIANQTARLAITSRYFTITFYALQSDRTSKALLLTNRNNARFVLFGLFYASAMAAD